MGENPTSTAKSPIRIKFQNVWHILFYTNLIAYLQTKNKKGLLYIIDFKVDLVT